MKVTLLSQKPYFYVKQIFHRDPAVLNLHTSVINERKSMDITP